MSVLTTLLNTAQKIRGEELSDREALELFANFTSGIAASLVANRAEIPDWELAHDKKFMADLLKKANEGKPE